MAVIAKRDFGIGVPQEGYLIVDNVSYNTCVVPDIATTQMLKEYSIDRGESVLISYRFYMNKEARKAYILSGWVMNNLKTRVDSKYVPSKGYSPEQIKEIAEHFGVRSEDPSIIKGWFDEYFQTLSLKPEEVMNLSKKVSIHGMNPVGQQLLNGSFAVYKGDKDWPTAFDRDNLMAWAYKYLKKMAYENKAGPLFQQGHPEWLADMRDDTEGSKEILEKAMKEIPELAKLKRNVLNYKTFDKTEIS